jgi:hypothetical protein
MGEATASCEIVQPAPTGIRLNWIRVSIGISFNDGIDITPSSSYNSTSAPILSSMIGLLPHCLEVDRPSCESSSVSIMGEGQQACEVMAGSLLSVCMESVVVANGTSHRAGAWDQGGPEGKVSNGGDQGNVCGSIDIPIGDSGADSVPVVGCHECVVTCKVRNRDSSRNRRTAPVSAGETACAAIESRIRLPMRRLGLMVV